MYDRDWGGRQVCTMGTVVGDRHDRSENVGDRHVVNDMWRDNPELDDDCALSSWQTSWLISIVEMGDGGSFTQIFLRDGELCLEHG